METVVLFIEIFIVSVLCTEEPMRNIFGHCTSPLGMEEGRIPDNAITASSSYEMKSVGPQNARIRQEKNGGAWCPKAQISSDIREYLEVDLTQNHLITWTETQGRFGNGQGQEYAEEFFLEYWRDDKWHQYKNLKGNMMLRGNSNTYLVEKQKLDLPFVASRVRFVPYSKHPRTVCMRVEIYGCLWEQRVAKYSAPKGNIFGTCKLEDTSYDGIEINGTMSDGLGQLIDGILGEAPENIDLTSSSSNWIGWYDRETVEIIFEFSEIQDFISCIIHVAHFPSLNIEVFSTVKIWISADGKNYPVNPEYKEVEDLINKSSDFITIPLQHIKSGKFVKINLKPKQKWLLISEITFKPRPKNVSIEKLEDTYKLNENKTNLNTELDKTNEEFNKTFFNINANLTPDAFPINNSQTYIGLVSGALTVVALFLTCTIFLMKQRGRNKVALLQKHTALLCGSSAPGITINMKDIKIAPPIIVNNLSQSRLSIKSKGYSGDDNTIRSSDNTTTSEYEQCSAYERTYKLFSEESISYEPPINNDEDFSSCQNDYAEFTNKHNCPGEKLHFSYFSMKKAETTQNTKPNRKVHEGYYAATDILTIKRREQHFNSSLFTPMHIKDCIQHSNDTDCKIKQISRHRLRILDKLGEGNFGLVHLCEAKGIQNPDFSTIRNRQVVIVRSLWRGVTESLREDFMKDMYVLATIRDMNIARILALVEEEPFGAVFEYGELGDLQTFLKNHNENDTNDTISSNTYLNFATQIASGMKYLECLNIHHCDLAARNCTVTKNYIIKVSDHAMYCSKYDHEYHINGVYAKVPLRWMSWEAILLGKQSCSADVWSYAITIWEIFTGCQELPYSDLSSEQVLENHSKWYLGGTVDKSQPRILSQPPACSEDLYQIMKKCWNKHTEDRPTFEEIYSFMKRLGFD